MKEMSAELATTGTYPDLNLLRKSMTDTEELAGPAGIMEEPSVAICGTWALETPWLQTYREQAK